MILSRTGRQMKLCHNECAMECHPSGDERSKSGG